MSRSRLLPWLGFVLIAVAAVASVHTALGGADAAAPPPPPPTASPAPPAPTPTPPPLATPAPGPPAAGPGLAVGVTEMNPNLVASPVDRQVPDPWAHWRDALGAIHPAYYRLVIDWASIQPSPDAPADLTHPLGGCMRDKSPCLGWAGVRDQLRALASRQAEGGWQGLVVFTGTPDWAAAPAAGCERPSAQGHSRPPRADALPAYQALVEQVAAAATEAGASLRFWSAWNEPNHPAFVSPQRAACDTTSPSEAPAAYAQLVHALQQALGAVGGDHQIVLGETAGIMRSTRYATSVAEFIAGLPQDVVCASTVWSQHAYIGGEDPVDAAAKALAARGCPNAHTIWITETGVGPAPKDLAAGGGIAGEGAGCEALHARLLQWYDDPRVTTAFQYTFRQDDRFPTGLVTTDLSAARPALAEWTAWGAGRPPAAPPPTATC